MADENLKNKTKKGVYWTFFNQLVINGFSFVVGVVMARHLSPSDYGITALPAVLIDIANVFIYGGLSTALVRKPEISEKDLSTSFIYSLSVGIVCFSLLFVIAPYVSDFYNEEVLTPLIRVTSLTFLWYALATPQNVILNRALNFKTLSKVTISTRIIGGGMGILCAILGYGLWSLVVMNVVSSLAQTVLLWSFVKWIPKEKWSKESFRYLWGFGNKLILVGILERIYLNITPIIIGKYFSTAELGLYNRAKGYADLPSQQGTNVVHQVTFPVLSRMQNDDIALANSYRKMLKVTAFVLFPIMMLLAALAHPFIVVLVTSKWEASVLYLQIMCFASMWYPIHAINLNLLQVKGRSDLFLRIELIKKVLGVIVIFVTLPFGLVVFCVGSVVYAIVSLFVNTFYTDRLIKLGFIAQMKDLLPTIGLSLLMYAVVTITISFIPNDFAQLIIGGIVGLGLYMLLARIFKFSELEDVKYMLNRRK